MDSIAILGAGGFAREVLFHLKNVYSDNVNYIFVDDTTDNSEINIGNKNYTIVNNWDFSKYSKINFIIGVGDPKLKKLLVEKAILSNIKPMETFIHPKALVQNVDLGLGGIICPGVVITTNVKIEDYVILNLNSTIGHDAIIEEYVTVNPGCHISGNTIIGKNTLLGTGCIVREKSKISSNVTIGAQSAVVSNILEEGVYVGIPAKKLSKNS